MLKVCAERAGLTGMGSPARLHGRVQHESLTTWVRLSAGKYQKPGTDDPVLACGKLLRQAGLRLETSFGSAGEIGRSMISSLDPAASRHGWNFNASLIETHRHLRVGSHPSLLVRTEKR